MFSTTSVLLHGPIDGFLYDQASPINAHDSTRADQVLADSVDFSVGLRPTQQRTAMLNCAWKQRNYPTIPYRLLGSVPPHLCTLNPRFPGLSG
jgi:hypothetical protein